VIQRDRQTRYGRAASETFDGPARTEVSLRHRRAGVTGLTRVAGSMVRFGLLKGRGASVGGASRAAGDLTAARFRRPSWSDSREFVLTGGHGGRERGVTGIDRDSYGAAAMPATAASRWLVCDESRPHSIRVVIRERGRRMRGGASASQERPESQGGAAGTDR
jgi:hypothetical protein